MIRLATLEDAQHILEIYNEAIVHTTAVYTYEKQTLQQRQQWLTQKKTDGFPVFVYELDGKAVGFATYGQFRPWPAYKYAVEHSIYVDQAYRKNKVGTKLLQALIDDITTCGYKTIIAGIDAQNDKSIALHEKFGFTYSGTIKNAGYKFERWLDLAFYQLQLDGPQQPVEG